ncbi:MAG: DUF2071 domain-containing protein [Phycisphaeraceae bacterium]|nr:DUF2071 domain-containing protein [Phycisphaeraceae bacterium]
MAMTWHDLLFMHWPVSPDALRPHVPEGLVIDTDAQGRAWLAVVPFRMSGVRPRFAPALPWLGAFPEINVRTYVRLDGPSRPSPGVYFFSLDAANPVAVAMARWRFHLRYMNARMCCRAVGSGRADGWIEYETVRTHRREHPAGLRARYRPVSEPFSAAAGSVESFFTDRYRLYAADRRSRVYRAEIHHAPWPLQLAEAHVEMNTMTAPLGIDLGRLPSPAPVLHFAKRLDVVAWSPQRVR